MPTGAGVHRGDENETRRETTRRGRAGDRDFACFERLAQHLQALAVELGQLVEKENAVVRE
jgi:hypothetical protein